MPTGSVPKVVEHQIIVLTKPSGSKQYLLTIPKKFANELEKKGVRSLIIVYNGGLGCFPASGPNTERAVLTFLSKHSDLMRLFSESETEQAQRKPASALRESRAKEVASDRVQ
jgi:hypothetical protein